ncbi:putative phospholipid-transporting ATPase 7 [Diplonema papillatum]|nr:putative phospholipid-transporting ATPase 7 [Diplonema papillatum]
MGPGQSEVVRVGRPDSFGATNFLKTSRYTVLSFLPLNLFEQFHQASNCYFLLNAIIALIPGVSPVSPITAIFPLIIVLCVAAVKDAFEDWHRHRADERDNKSPVTVMRDGGWAEVASKELRRGDVIKLKRGDAVKADVVVLSSDDPEGIVYIETAQLDGETSVKPRKAIAETAHLTDAAELAAALSADDPQHEDDKHVPDAADNNPDRGVSQQPAPTSDAGIVLTVDPPNASLYQWKGVLMYQGQSYPLGVKQTIWRGSSVRKTESAIAAVVYVGHDTKQGNNLRQRLIRKLSSLILKLNTLIVLIFAIKHVFIFLLAGLSVHWADANDHWYVSYWIDQYNSAERFLLNYLTFFILFSFLIPISLFVTVEIGKAWQVYLMVCDQELMYLPPNASGDPGASSWIGCRPKTSDLNEELAIVRYIFTDKTGTLTENRMSYVGGVVGSTAVEPGNRGVETASRSTRVSSRVGVEQVWTQGSDGEGDVGSSTVEKEWVPHCGLQAGTLYEQGKGLAPADGYPSSSGDARLFSGDFCSTAGGFRDSMSRYMATLALCHTVVPFQVPDSDQYEFEGTSPDEVALVRCAAENQFLLRRRTGKTITLAVEGVDHTFEVLDELEFSPTRKMMSIVVRDEHGTTLLLTKGADSSVLRQLSGPDHSPKDLSTVESYLVGYATKGFRTLCFGWRTVPEAEYAAWKRGWDAMQIDMAKTEDDVDAMCLKLETGLLLTGACAYEDKLQEEVPETIKFFTDASVVVWMLTGDKLETGIEIGRTCGLADGAEVFVISIAKVTGAQTTEEQKVDIVEARLEEGIRALQKDDGKKLALAIDGPTLNVIFASDERLAPLFVSFSGKITSAMCCRLTPAQKGTIVNMFRKRTGLPTLAIGDGANDATMITAASVGIGIIGLEGSQAELASDYAIPRFRHLKRLLAVHGRYALYRNALCICFSFYKNLVLTSCQVMFAFFSGYTGMTVFDGWLLAIKNTALTSLPPLLMTCFEKDLGEAALVDQASGPLLYKQLADGLYFDTKTIATWFTTGFVHGCLIFWSVFPYLLRDDTDTELGKTTGLLTSGTLMLGCVIYIICAKAVLHLRHTTSIQLLGVGISVLFYPTVLLVYSSATSVWGDTQFYQLANAVLSDPKYWLYCILSSVGFVSAFDLACHFAQRQFRPTLRDYWQELYPWADDRESFAFPFFGCRAAKSNRVRDVEMT